MVVFLREEDVGVGDTVQILEEEVDERRT